MLIRFPDRIEEVITVPNTGDGVLFEQAISGLRRGIPSIEVLPVRAEPAVICGGGPSLQDAENLAKIKKLQELGGAVFALNNSGKFLRKHGIKPDYQVVLDARPENVRFVRKRAAKCLLLATQCHPDVFDAAIKSNKNIQVFTHGSAETGERLRDALGWEKPPMMVGGSHTVGMVAMAIAYTLGYMRHDLFGYDSSHRGGNGHAYPQPMNRGDELVNVAVTDRGHYVSSLSMASQARAFPTVSQQLSDLGVEIHVHGDGLLPAIASLVQEGQETKVLTAVYDLAAAPPTWEFSTFLAEAERYRTDGGYTCIDLVVSPGVEKGYRYDYTDLFGKDNCDGMIQRIVYPLTRLLPSVRNVVFLKQKSEFGPDGPLFPPMWTPERPVSCYGPEHLHEGNRVFQATGVARKWREKNYPEAYVTITIREADYWPDRNSNRDAWLQAAAWLTERGYRVVFIPDTYGKPVDGYDNCTIAAWDIDLRMALYEGAALNMGVSNGPMALCYLSNAPYMIFGMLGKNSPITPAFYEGRGIPVGSQWGPNGRNVWEEDSPEVVMRELKAHFMKDQQEAA